MRDNLSWRKKVIRACNQCGAEYEGAGNSKYCSSSCSDLNNYEANMMKYEWRLARLLSMAKNRARSRGYVFDIDLAHLLELWEDNQGHCAVSGIKLELGRPGFGKVHPYAPSLDKIVPSLGYTKGNVRIVCYQINIAISEFGLEQFEELVKICHQNMAFRK